MIYDFSLYYQLKPFLHSADQEKINPQLLGKFSLSHISTLLCPDDSCINKRWESKVTSNIGHKTQNKDKQTEILTEITGCSEL
jgi:hypothetical protein